MEIKFKETKIQCCNVKYLRCSLGVRYFEDATLTIDGCETSDNDDNPQIPCTVKTNDGYMWCPVIDVETGKVMCWDSSVEADVNFKVCDDGVYEFINECGANLYRVKSYVPSCLSIGGEGYGDYVIMKIDTDGFIEGWKFDEGKALEILKGDFNHGSNFMGVNEEE